VRVQEKYDTSPPKKLRDPTTTPHGGMGEALPADYCTLLEENEGRESFCFSRNFP